VVKKGLEQNSATFFTVLLTSLPSPSEKKNQIIRGEVRLNEYPVTLENPTPPFWFGNETTTPGIREEWNYTNIQILWHNQFRSSPSA
jgi:hypothetical protein